MHTYILYVQTYVPGLKPGQVIQVKWTAFCVSRLSQTQIMKIFGSEPNLALTALLEYFDLSVHTFKVMYS